MMSVALEYNIRIMYTVRDVKGVMSQNYILKLRTNWLYYHKLCKAPGYLMRPHSISPFLDSSLQGCLLASSSKD